MLLMPAITEEAKALNTHLDVENDLRQSQTNGIASVGKGVFIEFLARFSV